MILRLLFLCIGVVAGWDYNLLPSLRSLYGTYWYELFLSLLRYLSYRILWKIFSVIYVIILYLLSSISVYLVTVATGNLHLCYGRWLYLYIFINRCNLIMCVITCKSMFKLHSCIIIISRTQLSEQRPLYSLENHTKEIRVTKWGRCIANGDTLQHSLSLDNRGHWVSGTIPSKD